MRCLVSQTNNWIQKVEVNPYAGGGLFCQYKMNIDCKPVIWILIWEYSVRAGILSHQVTTGLLTSSVLSVKQITEFLKSKLWKLCNLEIHFVWYQELSFDTCILNSANLTYRSFLITRQTKIYQILKSVFEFVHFGKILFLKFVLFCHIFLLIS